MTGARSRPGKRHRSAVPTADRVLYLDLRALPGPCRFLDARTPQAAQSEGPESGIRPVAPLLVHRLLPYPRRTRAALERRPGPALAAVPEARRRRPPSAGQPDPGQRRPARGQAVPRQLHPQPVPSAQAPHRSAGATDRTDPRPLRRRPAVPAPQPVGATPVAARGERRPLATAGRAGATGRLARRVHRRPGNRRVAAGPATHPGPARRALDERQAGGGHRRRRRHRPFDPAQLRRARRQPARRRSRSGSRRTQRRTGPRPGARPMSTRSTSAIPRPWRPSPSGCATPSESRMW